jgi:hypothetical protein
MIFLSYCQNNIAWVTPAYMLMLARCILRLYNFENAESTHNQDIQIQVLAIFVLLGLRTYFESTRKNLLASWIFIIVWAVG